MSPWILWLRLCLLMLPVVFPSVGLSGTGIPPDGKFPVSEDKSCISVTCHAGLGSGETVHEPASDGFQCTECHAFKKEGVHGFQPLDKGKSLCLSCHEMEEGSTAFHAMTPEGGCLNCHVPHGSKNPSLTKSPLPELCLSCHGTKTGAVPAAQASRVSHDPDRDTDHPPFAEGDCSACHQLHQSGKDKLLREAYPVGFYAPYSAQAYGLCLGCHPEMEEAFAEADSDQTGFRNGRINLHRRHVALEKGRACKACHHHHGSDNPKLIRKSFVFGEKELTLEYRKTDDGGECTTPCHAPARYAR